MNITDDYRQFAAGFLRLPVEKMGDEVALLDVIADSFQAVELLIALQDQFPCALSHEELADVDTLGQLFALVQRKSVVEN